MQQVPIKTFGLIDGLQVMGSSSIEVMMSPVA